MNRLLHVDRGVDGRIAAAPIAPIEIKSSWSRCAASSSRTAAAAWRCSGVVTSDIKRLKLDKTSMAGKWPRLASFRESQVWPSSRPRSASLIGSFGSSASTNTEYKAVIPPWGLRPAHSTSFGRAAKTDGG